MKPSTEKRLFRYALSSKKTISMALICLIIAVGLDLTGPLIARNIIDNHIVGIQNHWAEVEEPLGQTTTYHDRLLKRADRLTEADQVTRYYTLLQLERNYYLIDEQLADYRFIDVIDDNSLAVTYTDRTEIIQAEPITIDNLYNFFRPEIHPIMLWLGLYLGLIIIASVFQYLKTYLLQVYANKIIQRMREDAFSKIQELPMDYFVKRPAGKLLARVTNDTEAIKELYVRVLETFVNGVIYMTGIIIALFILNKTLATIALFLLPLLYFWMRFYKKYAGRYNEEIRSTNSDINASINESIQTMPIIQVFRRTKERQAEFEHLNERHYQYQKKMIVLSALTSYNLVNVLRGIAFIGFIWYFGSQSLSAEHVISAGSLYAFADFLTRLFEPMTQMINQFPQLEQARVAANRVFELFDEDSERVMNEPIERIKGEVKFKNIHFAYEKDNYILKNMTFSVEPGQTVAFVGHTGSGKSSVMNLLFRFYDPQKGTIELDGIDSSTLTRHQVRQHIGIVLQDPFIFTGTVLSNITLNDPAITREKAITALKTVGADKFIEHLPKQYDEPVGENGSEFSAGQRQLLSFARALAFDPAILILDEATANIDTETEGMIQQAMAILAKGRTMLVIAHRLSTIQHADQIIVLEKGNIIEKGTHEQLINRDGNYYQMYKMQQSGLNTEHSPLPHLAEA